MISMTYRLAPHGGDRKPGNAAGALAKPAAFAGRADELAPAIARSAGYRTRTLGAGEALFLQGDGIRHIHLLVEGWAFRYQCLRDGRRQIVDFALPGDILGLGESVPASCGVETLTPCAFAPLGLDDLMALLNRQPNLYAKMMETLIGDQTRAVEHLTSIGRRTARERVAYLLLELVRRAGASSGAGVASPMTLPLMLAHIADATGLTGETVCRCLTDLRRKGLLTLRGGRLDVLDIDGLVKDAGAEPQEILLPSNAKPERWSAAA